jgi:hypothetical protein
MSDDDDWVGEPPEGRHTREQSNPDFWRNQWQIRAVAGAAFVLLVVIAVIVLLV